MRLILPFFLFLFIFKIFPSGKENSIVQIKQYNSDTIKVLREYVDSLSDRKLRQQHYCYTIITNVNIVDAENNTVWTKRTVLLHDNEISQILESGKKLPHIPRGFRLLKIDGQGKYLAPGLCDMHVHYRCSTGSRLEYLLNGVTTIRNVNSTQVHFDEEMLLRNYQLIGPNLYSTTGEYIHKKINDTIYSMDSTSYHLRWNYYRVENDTMPSGNLDFTAQHKLPISIDTWGELTDPAYPDGTVFEQSTSLDNLKKLSNFKTFWFLSKCSFLSNMTDEQKNFVNEALLQKNILDLIKTNSDQFCIGSESGSILGNPISSMNAEMQLLSNAGIQNSTIIKMATQNAGMMVEKTLPQNTQTVPTRARPYSDLKFGKIKEGYRADLLLLNNNPLDNIVNYQKINSVFLNGTYLSPADLADMKTNLQKFK